MDGEEYAYECTLPKRILNLKNWEKLVKEVTMVEPQDTNTDGKKNHLVFAVWNDGNYYVHPHETFQVKCPQKVRLAFWFFVVRNNPESPSSSSSNSMWPI